MSVQNAAVEVSNVAVVVEPTVALVELSAAQAKAVAMMGKTEELDALAKSTLAARIKGDFKRYREALIKVQTEIYDRAMRSGFRIDISKDEYLKKYTQEAADIWAELA